MWKLDVFLVHLLVKYMYADILNLSNTRSYLYVIARSHKHIHFICSVVHLSI